MVKNSTPSLKLREFTKNDEQQCFKVNLGRVIARMRKCTGISQETMSRALSIHQESLSKIENGIQNLSAAQLCVISEYFQISAHDIITQRINYWDLAERFNQPPPIPKRYQGFYSSKVRELLPIISFLNRVYGDHTTHSLLERFGFDSALFQHFDQSISVHFTLDLFRELLSAQLLTTENFDRLIEQTWARDVHGDFLKNTYDAQDTSLKLIQARILNANHYERNFVYEIEELKNNFITVSASPSDELKNAQLKDNDLWDFLCKYRKEYFKNFPLYKTFKPFHSSDDICNHSKKNNKCTYILRVA